MKKITYLFPVLLLAASCSDSFFEEYPSNTVTEGNFYQTEDDFNQAVYACYNMLGSNMSFFQSYLSYRSDEYWLESMTTSNQDQYNIDHFSENPSTAILASVWSSWYKGIYRCNDVLDHAKGKELSNLPQCRADCLFLRSWFLFCLYRTFGVVPVPTQVVTPGEAMTLARCTKDEMLSRLEEDLTEAIEYLPEARPAKKARVSKIAAQTLLGKVYLTFGQYAKAEKILSDAMADTGYGLMETTAAAFDVTNKMNKEILFAICYNKSLDQGHGVWNSTTVLDDAQRPNPTAQYKGIYDKEKDNRYALIGYTQLGNQFVMTKWYDTFDAVYTTKVGNDFPLLRYADVVLMYAEAVGLGGNVAAAVPYLNQTRKRAGLDALPTTLSQDEFVSELVDERGREFAVEGQRWFDQVRLGVAKAFYGIDEHNLLFPIPKAQIEIINDTSILWQNPGF